MRIANVMQRCRRHQVGPQTSRYTKGRLSRLQTGRQQMRSAIVFENREQVSEPVGNHIPTVIAATVVAGAVSMQGLRPHTPGLGSKMPG